MRPIDADAFLGTSIKEKRFVFDTKDYVNAQFVVRVVYKDLAEALNNAPTLDVAPVRHGRWIGIEYDGYADGCPVYDVFECSECGYEHKGESDTLTSYCPNCGAKMDLPEPPKEDE